MRQRRRNLEKSSALTPLRTKANNTQQASFGSRLLWGGILVVSSLVVIAALGYYWRHGERLEGLAEQSFTETSANDSSSRAMIISKRYPRFGTARFANECKWTLTDVVNKPSPATTTCTILVRPADDETEGIADWIALLVSGLIAAQLQACRLFVDYGPHVDISQVIVPIPNSIDWTVPAGYECATDPHCVRWTKSQHMLKSTKFDENDDHNRLLTTPNYRFVHQDTPRRNIYRENFRHIEHALPGFQLETGFTCAMQRLMQLSPTALTEQHEIISALSSSDDDTPDTTTLVMTVYLRSGQTDKAALVENHVRNASTVDELERGSRKLMDKYMPCVLEIERELLLQLDDDTKKPFDRVVWLVVSDSPTLKESIRKEYTTSSDATRRVGAPSPILQRRQIITTSSRGIHTRAARNPSTTDFVEAMTDWYLMGESSHAVLTNGQGKYTFGTTAALRTNRPLYDLVTCSKMPSFIHEDTVPPTIEEVIVRDEIMRREHIEALKKHPRVLPHNLIDMLAEANT